MLKRTRNEIKSKIETIKKINDDPKLISSDNIYDKYLNDLPTTDQLFGKKLDAFLDKRKKKIDNNKDIFGEMVDIADSFLGIDKKNTKSRKNVSVDSSDKLVTKSKIKRYAVESAEIATSSYRKTILNNVKKILFAGDGICGGNSILNVDSVNLSPKEFDLTNTLTINPTSNVGKIVYEPQNPNINKQKVNRELYNLFSSGSYNFVTNNNNTLFTTSWDQSNQQFMISGLTQTGPSIQVDSFLNDYYSSIELPDINNIVKNSMMLTLQPDTSASSEFILSQNEINRLLKKLFSICGSQTNKETLKNQNAVEQFEENDQDLEFYFDFDSVEGIDLDDEDSKVRRVLKFTDCNNFELPVNDRHFEDFVYLTDKQTINDVVDGALSKSASDAFEQSDGSIPLLNFHISIMNSFIMNLPKSLIMSILSPKIFLPIVILYKVFNSLTNVVVEIKTIILKLKKLIYLIVKEIFWKFIREFWKRIKKDLLIFLELIIFNIIKNRYKRYVTIVTALIFLLKNILQNGIDNCSDLFNTIINTINGTLSGGRAINIPGFLLGLSDNLPGYSQDRAYLNIVERLNAAGIPTGPIYGESNDLLSIIKSHVDGDTEERDKNQFIKGSNKEVQIGPYIIPPGIINIAGKSF
jgi:hypothetical protein